MFDKLVNPQVRNTLVTDILALSSDDAASKGRTLGKLHRPPAEIIAPLEKEKVHLPKQVYLPSRLTVGGITYTTRSVHEGNSNIIVDDVEDNPQPLSIEHFVTIPKTAKSAEATWVIVRRLSAAQVKVDPYGSFRYLRAMLRDSTRLSSKREVLRPNDLQTHFAKCIIPWEKTEVAVVISLSRVCGAAFWPSGSPHF